MSLLGILLIIFILLKAFNVIDWSWAFVFVPAYLMALVFLIQILIFAVFAKKAKSEFDRFHF